MWHLSEMTITCTFCANKFCRKRVFCADCWRHMVSSESKGVVLASAQIVQSFKAEKYFYCRRRPEELPGRLQQVCRFMLLLQFSWTRNFQRGRSQLNRLKGLRKCLQRQVFRLQNPLKHFNNQPKGKETYFCNPSMKRHMSPLLTPNSLALESTKKKAIKLRRRKMNTTSRISPSTASAPRPTAKSTGSGW